MDPLSAIAAELGPAPRRCGPWERRTRYRLDRPAWLRSGDGDRLNLLFEHAADLWRNGAVTWGHLVQANNTLFEPGRGDAPGELVFSTADPAAVRPGALADVARAVADLKGTRPDDTVRRALADHLTDEMTRAFGLEVPSGLGALLPCRLSTVLFVRRHLPGGRLACPLVPVVVRKKAPNVAAVVPRQFWPPAFAAWWRDPGGGED